MLRSAFLFCLDPEVGDSERKGLLGGQTMAINGEIQLSQFDPLLLLIHGNFAHTETTENPEGL